MMNELLSSVTATRNSELRRITAHIPRILARRLHDKFPDLTADHLTFLGAIGTGIGGFIATLRNGENSPKNKKLTITSGLVMVASAGMDALDGQLAREMEQSNPGSGNLLAGQVKDAASDSFQELFLSIARAISAHKRGSKLGEIMALVNGATNSLSRLSRAFAESRQKPVPETGVGPVGIIGTRAGLAVLGIAATLFPEVREVPVQVAVDALVTGANIVTALQRTEIALDKSAPTLDEKTRQEAEIRFKALLVIEAISIGAAVITYKLLHSHSNHRQ